MKKIFLSLLFGASFLYSQAPPFPLPTTYKLPQTYLPNYVKVNPKDKDHGVIVYEWWNVTNKSYRILFLDNRTNWTQIVSVTNNTNNRVLHADYTYLKRPIQSANMTSYILVSP